MLLVIYIEYSSYLKFYDMSMGNMVWFVTVLLVDSCVT